MTEHEANNNLIWVSDKLWQSLSADQKRWVQAAADEVNMKEPAMAMGLEHQSADKLKTMGVMVVDKVDKSGFQKLANPYLDKLAGELGPYAVKIKDQILAVK
jgi:TRAP-type C4-dicarboxylate transport system substrate-binding protein